MPIDQVINEKKKTARVMREKLKKLVTISVSRSLPGSRPMTAEMAVLLALRRKMKPL